MRRDYFTDKTIYIVDDSDATLQEAKDILSEHFHVRTFNSAAKMVMLASRTVPPPDLILLDIEMPDMHGSEAVSKTQSIPEWENVPIVLLTAWNSDMLLDHFFAMGVFDVIHKPIVKSVMLNRVENCIKLSEYIKTYGDHNKRYTI